MLPSGTILIFDSKLRSIKFAFSNSTSVIMIRREQGKYEQTEKKINIINS
jgi:hypothetical protein